MKTLYLVNLPKKDSELTVLKNSQEDLQEKRESLEETIDNLIMSHNSIFGFPFSIPNAFMLSAEMLQRATEIYTQLLYEKDMLECVNKELELRYIEELGGLSLFKESEDVILAAVNNSLYENSILQLLDKAPLRQAIKLAEKR